MNPTVNPGDGLSSLAEQAASVEPAIEEGRRQAEAGGSDGSGVLDAVGTVVDVAASAADVGSVVADVGSFVGDVIGGIFGLFDGL